MTDEEMERIRKLCGNHPYQIQLLCRRFLDCGDLDTATKEVAHDRAVSFFFSVDFDLLGKTEQKTLRLLAQQPSGTLAVVRKKLQLPADAAETSLSALHELGFVGRDTDGRYDISSHFLRRWLSEDTTISRTEAE